jgi:hypothetical protein
MFANWGEGERSNRSTTRFASATQVGAMVSAKPDRQSVRSLPILSPMGDKVSEYARMEHDDAVTGQVDRGGLASHARSPGESAAPGPLNRRQPGTTNSDTDRVRSQRTQRRRRASHSRSVHETSSTFAQACARPTTTPARRTARKPARPLQRAGVILN